ncbi:MAG: hypothetical protein OEM23_03080 [Gemmatimonadota bacterium]|nr:hypothetical protein [Gemmatimonadota bacterium]MDH3427395.1 hypothetical protein [Gemmatimonadota bacterium]
MKTPLLVTAIAALALVVVPDANAQTNVNTTLSFTMQQRLFLDVDDAALVFPDPTTADLDAGLTQTVAHNVEHRGNVDHVITVAPSTATWNVPVSYPGTKPADDLEWSTNAGTTWNVVSAAVNVGTGVRGGAGLNPDIPVTWRAAVGYDEPAGAYNIVVTYTSTAN